MGSAIADVVPAAIGVVLVNPLPLIAVIVMLFSPRAMTTAPAFVAGWVAGLVAAKWVLLFVVSRDFSAGSTNEPSLLASILRLALGILLFSLALRQWRGRPKPGEEKPLPGWMASLEQASPFTALGLGALLSGLNPKNLAFTVGAAVAIAQADLPPAQSLILIAVYVLLASIGVAAPVIWYAVSRESAIKTLGEWRRWLTTNYAIIMTVVLTLFGVILFSKGLGGLIG